MYISLSLIALVLILQVYVTFRIHRSNIYDGAQKGAQVLLIWLLPALGAVIVFSVLQQEERVTYTSNSQPKR